MKRPLMIVANWKMFKTVKETLDYFKKFSSLLSLSDQDVYIAPPFTSIYPLFQVAGSSGVKIGSQNVSEYPFGPYTGEVCASMIKEAGGTFSLIGHSERRRFFHENSSMIHQKILRCQEAHLTPIVCIGETEEEKNLKQTHSVLHHQLEQALLNLDLKSIENIVIAYEPIWAIGTGKVPTHQVIQNIHHECRNFLEKKYGNEVASKIKILYGGSVNQSTIALLLANKDVDGVLVGGAALDPENFANIIKLSRELKK